MQELTNYCDWLAVQSKVEELRREQDLRTRASMKMDVKLDRFLRNACEEAGLKLPEREQEKR